MKELRALVVEMRAPEVNEMSRYVDFYLSNQGDATESLGRLSTLQSERAPSLMVVVKVVLWDGNRKIMPTAQLGPLRRDVLIYDTAEIKQRRSPAAPPVARAPSKQKSILSVAWGASKRLLQSVAAPSSHSLEDYVLYSTLFDQSLSKCARRHRSGNQPAFFLLGKQIYRDMPFATPKTIGGVLRGIGNSVEWSEITLDLALNEAAEKHLREECYHRSSTIAVQIEALELAEPASDDAPFGLPPSTYVSVQHGATTRYSHIERNTLTPIFQWTAGGIPYRPEEPLKICVHMAGSREGRTRNDPIVGQMWLSSPVLPLPNAILYPELMAMSLGASVGIIHLSIKGPSLRRKSVPGCVCDCCCCTIPICGSPPCMPSLGTCAARGAASCLRTLRSEQCETFTTYACCCCIALGLTFLLEKAPQAANAALGATRQAGGGDLHSSRAAMIMMMT